MMARAKATKDSAAAIANARLEIGAGTWDDGLVGMLHDIADGFTNIKSSAIQTFKDIGKSISQDLSQNLTDVIMGAQSLQEAFANIGETILKTLINAIIQMGVQWAATTAMNQILGTTAAATATSTAAASGAAITAEMAPAAAATSLATMGGNTITASAGVLAFGAVMAAMLGALFAGAFDNGGYIPDGKFGIVGEYGPEIIQGPVAVTGRKTTEDILSSSRKESENRANAASAQTNNVEVKNDNRLNIYNVLSPEVVISALRSPIGEKAVLNVIDRNRTKVNI